MIFGERIKQLRTEKQWTQEYVCEKLNISTGALSRYETSMYEPKSLELIKDFATLFNVSADYLLGKSYYRNYEEFKKTDDLVLNYQRTPEETEIIAKTLNYINQHKDENVENIVENAVKDISLEKREILRTIILHLHYRYHGKLPKLEEPTEQEFKTLYSKEMEGLTEEEIAEALRFYKQIKYGNNNV